MKNNKGFMLVEVVITATIVLSSMIALYTGFTKLYNNYKIKNNYSNIDAYYATKELVNALIEDEQLGGINNVVSDSFYDLNFCFLISEDINLEDTYLPFSFNSIKTLYGVNKFVISEYDKSSLESIKNANVNQTFKDYIDYVIDYYGISGDEEYDYIVLTELKNSDKYYYANLRIR